MIRDDKEGKGLQLKEMRGQEREGK